jgi:hypothetical protein
VPKGSKSAAVRDLAVACLLASRTVQEAARRARVPYPTLRRWIKRDANFRAAYAAARREFLEHALGRLQSITVAAVVRLRRLLDSREESVALRAAQAILGHALTATEQLDILARVEKLEQANECRQANTHPKRNGHHRGRRS